MEPEAAHDFAINGLRMAQIARAPLMLLSRSCHVDQTRLGQKIWGLDFRNPVGLAAGFDKNGEVLEGMQALGFGFLEVGTVTPMPQRGNPKPRMFRFPAERSLQNSLGFNNEGVDKLRRRLAHQERIRIPVGVNIGKNKDTPAEEAIEEYARQVVALEDRCDYLVINISSPNTPGLRDLQRKEQVEQLVSRCRECTAKPVLIKLAPDLEITTAVELSTVAVDAGAAGIILTNTTTDFSLIEAAAPVGGLSGQVLRQRSYEMLCAVSSELFGHTVLVSVGGVDSATEVIRRLRAGASLVQIYTGLVYGGPGLIFKIVQEMDRYLVETGAGRLEEVIGQDAGKDRKVHQG